MHTETLAQLRCPRCEAAFATAERPASVAVYGQRETAQGVEIEEASVTCPGCGSWWRVEETILDLLPDDLADPERRAAFAKRHGLAFDGKVKSRSGESVEDLAMKRGQQDFFGSDVEDYEADVVNHPYFSALDHVSVFEWKRKLRAGQRVLDLGAGSGRTTVPLAEQGLQVLALDISEPMLRKAQERLQAAGLEHRADLFLGDAERLPVADACLDGAAVYGSLHHLPSPGRAIAEMSRTLRRGGLFFSMDPNESPVRWIFDMAMRLRRQWVEEASDHPLQNPRQLRAWCDSAGLEVDIWFSTYLLPHFFAHATPETAERWLRLTDGFFGKLPGIRRFAGIIGASGRKSA